MQNQGNAAMTQELRERIDMLAIQCCHKMGAEAREQFFATSTRDTGAGHAHGGVHRGERYERGARKGEARQVYRLDGPGFCRLWDALETYAKTRACFSLNFRVKSPDYEDVVAAIRERLIMILMFEGPVFGNSGFSSIAMTAIGQVLVQEARARKTQAFEMISKAMSVDELSEREAEDSDFNGTVPDQLVDYGAQETMLFEAGIPDHLREPVADLVGGEGLYPVGRRHGIDARKLRREIVAMLQDDGEPM